jgi:putative transcriptional regulator
MSVQDSLVQVKKRSKILDAVHETAKGLHAAGAIDQVTMRELDQACLSPVPPLRAAEIKGIREREHVSRPHSTSGGSP